MKGELIRKRMNMVFTKNECERISIRVMGDKVNLTVDVHKMTCIQAKIFLQNIMALLRDEFSLTVIHGYHNGTAIRDMVRQTPLSPKITGIRWNGYNDGLTEFNVRALCA